MNDEQVQLQAMEMDVKSRMSKDALYRFGNIRVSNLELATNLVMVLSQSKQAIDDDLLKNLILKLNKKKEFNIRYK